MGPCGSGRTLGLGFFRYPHVGNSTTAGISIIIIIIIIIFTLGVNVLEGFGKKLLENGRSSHYSGLLQMKESWSIIIIIINDYYYGGDIGPTYSVISRTISQILVIIWKDLSLITTNRK